ncbi:CATRA conflict system CASPASE/TPR repeat-associated protein [Kitasatospora purpeofusca]|uniref:CATRA conflict system CASPASE/TPR repeat-associated protein n=1 Tax=Kitasatospora purpeofusca TaxID=67352 RepID=UPI0036D3C571
MAEPALVVHAFFVTGPAGADDGPGAALPPPPPVPGEPAAPVPWREALRPLWRRCRELGITEAVPGASWPQDPPEAPLPPWPDGSGFQVLAAGTRAGGPPVRQAVLYRCQDVLGLSVALDPADPARGWDDLDDAWPADLLGTLGTVRLYLGLVPGQIGAARAESALSPVRAESAWVVLPGGFALAALAEAPPPGGSAAPPARRLTVLAAPEHESALYDLVWADGGRPGVQPLTRHLLNAAKLHYEAQVYRRDQHYRAARIAVQDSTRRLSVLLDRASGAGEPLPVRELIAGQTALLAATARTNGLVGALGDLVAMRRTVQGLAQALRRPPVVDRHAPPGPDTVSGSDLALADWLEACIDDDTALLGTVRDTAAAVSEAAGTVIRDLLNAREQRVMVAQTALLGGLVTALAAIQSFGIKIDVAGPARKPLVLTLAALSVAVPVAALQFSQRLPGARFGRLAAWAAGAAGCCLGWLGMGLLAAAGHRTGPAWTVAAAALCGALTAGAVHLAGRRARAPRGP